jgi:hypothetical protein
MTDLLRKGGESPGIFAMRTEFSHIVNAPVYFF